MELDIQVSLSRSTVAPIGEEANCLFGMGEALWVPSFCLLRKFDFFPILNAVELRRIRLSEYTVQCSGNVRFLGFAHAH